MQFQSKNTFTTEITNNYNNKMISNNTNLKFLGLLIDSRMFWKMSYWKDHPHNKTNLFYDQNNKINIITLITKNYLLYLFSFSYDVRT